MNQLTLSTVAASRDGEGEVASAAQEEVCGCSLTRFTDWLTEIRDEQPAWRGQADREVDYYDGNQLDSATLRDMEEIGMPPIIENVIAPAIDAVLGMEAKTRTDWKVTADQDGRDSPVAEAMNYRMAQAEKATRADRAGADAYASQVKTGLGWVEVSRENDPFKYPYRVQQVHRNEIFWDMRSHEMDGSDMRFMIRRRWTDVDVAAQLFPKHASLIKHVGNGWSLWDEQITMDGGMSTDLAMSGEIERGWSIEEVEWRDANRRRVCIFEVWYRDWVRGLIIRTPDGRVVEFDQCNENHVAAVGAGLIEPEYATFAKVRMAYWIGPHKLHDGPSPYKHNRFPYVAFWGKREDRTGVPYGLIRPMLPMQDAINASESKMQWLLAAKRITQTEGVTLDDEEAVRREAARPDAHFILDAQKLREGGMFKVESDFALNEQQYRRLVDKREGIRRVSGVFASFSGEASQAQSGLAINSLVEQSTQTLAEINDNYRFARAEVGEILLSYVIEDIGDKQTVMKIPGKLPGDEDKEVVLNEPTVDEMGIQYLSNDVQRTRLKMALSDVPSTSSFRSQQLMALSEVVKSLPPPMQAIVVPFVLALTDIPNRDDIVKAIKGTVEGRTFTAEQVQAEVQNAVQAALQQSGHEHEQAKLQLDAEKVRLEEKKIGTEIAKLELERFGVKSRAHVDNLRAEADWLRAEIEDRRQRAEIASKEYERQASSNQAPEMPIDPETLPDVLKARIDADAQVRIAEINRAASAEISRLEAKLDEISKQIAEDEPEEVSTKDVMQAIQSMREAKPAEPQPAPVINVTIEKGGTVRKEIEVKSPSGATYKGVVSEEEE